MASSISSLSLIILFDFYSASMTASKGVGNNTLYQTLIVMSGTNANRGTTTRRIQNFGEPRRSQT